ncbi:malate dehydrogenase (quinone) [Engelhardtia mirabilis]|uniref:Probable malate:quinone oxidoreductase n=1 Tax=Engelhardtia mirabilis TaxID=2528011 RepID=A0A518BJK8_9BACT|nr:Malate:quinone oxidoreductase [Planctomycetes bacterium Pla133]QDV01498.1 Malate:quinone oxidoreductase [Planctomycetes bacterium Pla86]
MSSSPAGGHPVVDVALVGAGIMSATLGAILRRLEPGLSMVVLERLDQVATESSSAWNNAGTGHSAFCELNYTPERADGTIDISKAEKVAAQFELSRHFWASMVESGVLGDPRRFLHSVPHMSFVVGAEGVDFLHRRCEALSHSPLFAGLQFCDDRRVLADWLPLMFEGREGDEVLAATRMDAGTDVDFGALTKRLFESLASSSTVSLGLEQEVRDLVRKDDGLWRLKVRDRRSGEDRIVRARFVFIGAGGGALRLLERSEIPEAEGYGGFPVSGQWLRCNNPQVSARHRAKVYGRPVEGSPPMSMPHLDTRVIDGHRELLFGPYAGFSTRFLKRGSLLDLPRSVDLGNLLPMLEAGADNVGLMGYLLGQVLESREERVEALREFYPAARDADWELVVAGQRVQVIKDEPGRGGVLEFGTELVACADGSLAALLGASPGASTAVAVALEVLERCFPERLAGADWQAELRVLVPGHGLGRDELRTRCGALRAADARVLGLDA